MGEWLEPAVELTVVGLAVVFLVLGSIAVAIALVGRIDARWRLQEAAAEAAASAREPTIDRITLVLIATAAATVLGGRHRIHSVRLALRDGGSASPWSSQGRAVLLGSHVVPRRTP